MAYYFAVETEENSYVAKNIRNSKYFGAEYRTNIPYECTLGEIDDFTATFKNETELKESLLKENIIDASDLDKNIAIIFTKGIKRGIFYLFCGGSRLSTSAIMWQFTQRGLS